MDEGGAGFTDPTDEEPRPRRVTVQELRTEAFRDVSRWVSGNTADPEDGRRSVGERAAQQHRRDIGVIR